MTNKGLLIQTPGVVMKMKRGDGGSVLSTESVLSNGKLFWLLLPFVILTLNSALSAPHHPKALVSIVLSILSHIYFW